MTIKTNFGVDYQSVTDIMACQSIEGIRAAASKFIEDTDKVRDENNGIFVWDLGNVLNYINKNPI